MLTRRQALRAAGVLLTLPYLESLAPHASAADVAAANAIPLRMVCICQNLGLHMPNWVPIQAGRDYKPSRYLKHINDLRHYYTVFSGVSHPEVDGAHRAEKSFLTCAPHPASSSFKNSISLDQVMAGQLGVATRYPSLVLASNGSKGMSWTRAGVPIPPEQKPSRVFSKLFVNGTKGEVEKQITRLSQNESILDTVLEQAKGMQRQLSHGDIDKFDEYLTSVREVEVQMQRRQEWERKPKQMINVKPPIDIQEKEDVVGRARLMYDLMHLALETDTTRFITMSIEGPSVVPNIAGVDEDYHTLSHHGMKANRLAMLGLVEDEFVKAFGYFLRKLHASTEQNDTLLNRTMVFYGGDMGNASSHDNRNLPAMLAGGGFKHGQHLAFDVNNNYPLANCFLSMLHRVGLPVDQFGNSTGTMTGLEFS